MHDIHCHPNVGSPDPLKTPEVLSVWSLQSLGPTDGGMMPLPTSTYLWPSVNASPSASSKVGTVGTC